MKVAPILEQIRRRKTLEGVLVHTGQHYDHSMSDAFFRDLGLPAPEILMVGDRLETDLGLARTAGMASAIVLSGATDEAALARWPEAPDFILGGIAGVLPA